MPPRFAYWTILADGLPTAFRAAERDELLPTFKRIQAKHPDAEMRYFARGKLWASADEARRAAEAARARSRPHRESRRPEWRPGGDHRDPRQQFKDAKKARNLDRRKLRFERREATGRAGKPDAAGRNRPPREKPRGNPLRRSTSRSFATRHQDTQEPPRPGEPAIRPPGQPERERGNSDRFGNRRRRS